MMEKTTDQLIDEIISMGLKLPYYEWEVKQFASEFPDNAIIDGMATGVLKTAYFETFREACSFIIDKMKS